HLFFSRRRRHTRFSRDWSSDVCSSDRAAQVKRVLAEMAQEDGSTFQPAAALFQDFCVRCRMRGIRVHGLDAVEFRKRFAAALAGLDPRSEEHTSGLQSREISYAVLCLKKK